MSRIDFVARACVSMLLLAVGVGAVSGLAASSRVFVHDPPDPSLPPPLPRADRAFRLAAHTLFLDEPIAQLAEQAGFDTVVQVFPWRDLNPRPGTFSWQAADDMVRTARTHRLDLVMRLDKPPFWAQRGELSQPPFDVAAYLDFVEAVASRYRGYVTGYIIWNEPNLAEEWGGWVAQPAQYVEVLCQAHKRVRRADPGARVIAAGLAPTNEFSPRAMDDREFLRQMMDGGAGRCFDVLAAHDYGYGLPPDDPHGEHGGLNLARLLDLRAILDEAHAVQPVWITELGYTVEPGLHPHVSLDDQAGYLLGAFRRVRAEWPWVEMFAVWNLSYTSGTPEMQGFSIIEPNRAPRPAYAVVSHMRRELGVP